MNVPKFRVVFLGTPQFAANILIYLLGQGIEVVAVVTRTDKAKGRSGKPQPPPVKEVALQHDLPLYQPEKISSEEFIPTLQSFNADLFVVVAYGEILRQHVLDTPKHGCINLHASLLPKFRGAAPIQRSIIDGNKETGITIMHLVRKMDAGAIIKQKSCPIDPDETYGSLETKLCELGKEPLLEVIHAFQSGTVTETEQNEDLVTFAPKLELEDTQIDWSRSAQEIHDLVRGVNPFPAAWCNITINGEKKRLKVFLTEVQPPQSTQIDKTGLIVACGEDSLKIIELQLEGKKRMKAGDFAQGVAGKEIKFLSTVSI